MKFHLRENYTELITWDQDSFSANSEELLKPITVFEEKRYGLSISEPYPHHIYILQIGDERLVLSYKEFDNFFELESSNYFESAAGETDLLIFQQDKDGIEKKVSQFKVYVVPSKIGEHNYKKMVLDLQKICHSLINDLIGKSKHSQEGGDFKLHAFRSHEEELSIIGDVWRRFIFIIKEVMTSPTTIIRPQIGLIRNYKNKSFRNQIQMMKRGADPTKENCRICICERLIEQHDTYEHQLFKNFMLLLQKRIIMCRRGIKADLERLRKDEPFRNQSPYSNQKSLFETEDIPRIAILNKYDDKASEIFSSIEMILQNDFWQSISRFRQSSCTMQFSEGVAYRTAVNIIFQYLHKGYHQNPLFGSNFMTKKSSRIFEQWVLTQLVTSFEQCGLEFLSWDEIIKRSLNRQFNLDFKKNTSFKARFNSNYFINVRYEPWILPNSMVRSYPEETLFHGGSADSFWSPDITIELQNAEQETIYAIVIDCKYSRNPHPDMRDGIKKYEKIRAVSKTNSRGKQITRQVWLAYPGELNSNNSIVVDDEYYVFLAEKGPCYQDDQTQCSPEEFFGGDIIVHPTTETDTNEKNNTPLIPENILMTFAKGTLAYFQTAVYTEF